MVYNSYGMPELPPWEERENIVNGIPDLFERGESLHVWMSGGGQSSSTWGFVIRPGQVPSIEFLKV